jgi:hypothetical protein
MIKLKNMKLGSKSNFLFFFLFINYISCFADDKIISSELINLEKIKPSFEEIEELNNTNIKNELIKNKNKDIKKNKIPSAKLIGLDKITSKTFEITVNIGETTKIGFLEIKVLKCGKQKSKSTKDNVAYLQVKDLSENQDEKVFIFNGWTFSSDPTLTPFDHAIYDLQLVDCNNV